jgi:hypothetical protein
MLIISYRGSHRSWSSCCASSSLGCLYFCLEQLSLHPFVFPFRIIARPASASPSPSASTSPPRSPCPPQEQQSYHPTASPNGIHHHHCQPEHAISFARHASHTCHHPHSCSCASCLYACWLCHIISKVALLSCSERLRRFDQEEKLDMPCRGRESGEGKRMLERAILLTSHPRSFSQTPRPSEQTLLERPPSPSSSSSR